MAFITQDADILNYPVKDLNDADIEALISGATRDVPADASSQAQEGDAGSR